MAEGSAPVELHPQQVVAARQAAWREQSLVAIRRSREKRLTDLEARHPETERALTAYMALNAETDPVVRLRPAFVALLRPRELPEALGGPPLPPGTTRSEQRRLDMGSRPPLTRLTGARSTALGTWLSLVFVAHATRSPARTWTNTRRNASKDRGQESWAVLCGQWASRERTRRARLTRALDDLEAADLVSLGARGNQGRYERFRMLDETGSGGGYRVPAADDREALPLPTTFFTKGWHLILTPAEVATLLVFRHAEQHFDGPADPDYPGVPLTQHERWSRYGLSPEAYQSAHELEEFGLLSMHDPMPHRRRGKFQPPNAQERARLQAEGQSFAPVPYHLHIKGDEVFDRPAAAIVQAAMGDLVPPRLRDGADFLL